MCHAFRSRNSKSSDVNGCRNFCVGLDASNLSAIRLKRSSAFFTKGRRTVNCLPPRRTYHMSCDTVMGVRQIMCASFASVCRKTNGGSGGLSKSHFLCTSFAAGMTCSWVTQTNCVFSIRDLLVRWTQYPQTCVDLSRAHNSGASINELDGRNVERCSPEWIIRPHIRQKVSVVPIAPWGLSPACLQTNSDAVIVGNTRLKRARSHAMLDVPQPTGRLIYDS